MRISDLSRVVGLPVPTIKFYLREGLLPRGRPTGRNQAAYGEEHLRRLQLIRTLTTVGQLNLSTVRQLLSAVESGEAGFSDMIRMLTEATLPDRTCHPDGPDGSVQADRILSGLGCDVTRDSPGHAQFELALGALEELGCTAEIDILAASARCIGQMATAEIRAVPEAQVLENEYATFVARTVLIDVALMALRRMAQDHELKRR